MALEIFIPNTGQGDCTFIKFPNGKNMLVDFNKTDVDVDIIKLLRAKDSQDVFYHFFHSQPSLLFSTVFSVKVLVFKAGAYLIGPPRTIFLIMKI